MDGVGWFGTAIILSPVLATVLLLALVVAFAMHRTEAKRRKDQADRDTER